MEEILKKSLNNIGDQLKAANINLALAHAQVEVLTTENVELKKQLEELKFTKET